MPETRSRKLLVVAVALSSVAILAPAPARAQSAEPGTVNANLVGRPHSFVVPPGWTGQPGDDSVVFTPPSGKMHGDFNCFVLAVGGQFAGQAPKDFARTLAQGQQKESMPWGAVTEPDDMTFVGLPAALISVGGTNPTSNAAEAMVILVAPASDIAYAFVVKGRTDDIQATSSELAMIINGVQPTSAGKPGPAGNKNAPAGSQPAGEPGCVGFGCNAGPAPTIDDPPWGLGVQGLSKRWRVENDKGKYVFMAAKPDTRVTVTHRWKDDAGYKASLKKAKGAKAKLGRHDALLVEEAGKKTWHITLGAQVTVIELAGRDLAAAEADAWPEFLNALSLVKKDTPPIANAKKGVRMTLANGVSIELAKGWMFTDSLAAGATYAVREKKGFTLVQVRTGSTEGALDPFSDEYVAAQWQCKPVGRVQETTLSVTGATKVRQSVCQVNPGADKTLVKDVPKIVVLAEGPGVQMFLFAKSDGSDIPETRVREFLTAISLPR